MEDHFDMGEINVAVGVAGLKPIRDRRGEKDLFGYVLRVKQTAIGDELASAAELVIGQANEGIPVAIIRGYNYQSDDNVPPTELIRAKRKRPLPINSISSNNLSQAELARNELKSWKPQTPKEFFEKTLPERFKPEKAAGIDVIAQLTLTGPSGGDWVVSIKDQKIQITEGTDPSATLTLESLRQRLHGYSK